MLFWKYLIINQKMKKKIKNQKSNPVMGLNENNLNLKKIDYISCLSPLKTTNDFTYIVWDPSILKKFQNLFNGS